MRFAQSLAVVAVVLTACVTNGADYVAAVLSDAPVAYWRLGEATGTIADDEGGLFAGVYEGGIALGQAGAIFGDVDTAALFNGSLGTRVRVPYSAALNPGGSFTIEAWARLEQGNTGFRAPVSSRDGLPQAGYILYSGPASGSSVNHWQFWTGPGTLPWNHLGRNQNGFAQGPVVRTGEWFHLVGTFEASGAPVSDPNIAGGALRWAGAQRMYVNGKLVMQATSVFMLPNPLQEFWVAAGANEGAGSFWWVGKLDEVAFYDYALPSERIKQHWVCGAQLAENIVISDWQPLFRGVDLATGASAAPEPRILSVHTLRIDLRDPDVEFFTTPANGPTPLEADGQTCSQFLAQHKLVAAINANFFSPCCSTVVGEPKDIIGLSISQGMVVSPAVSSGSGSVALLITADNAASIAQTRAGFDPSAFFNAVAGSPRLLLDGQIVAALDTPEPRTAVGLSQDGRFLYFMTIDGRQPGFSEGTPHAETAEWLLRFGAWQGLNLDGGGSTTMVVRGRDGQPLVLNSPISGGIQGNERVNANHIGLWAAPLRAACPGDLNGDLVIDQADLNLLLAEYGCSAGPARCSADLTGDGQTDQQDLNLLLARFGAAC